MKSQIKIPWKIIVGIFENLMKKHKKITIGVIAFIGSLLVVYFGISIYFMDRFNYGTVINSINVSGKTVEEVKNQLSSELQAYTLTILERDGKAEQIKGSNIGLKLNSEEQIDELKENQNPLAWVPAFLNNEKTNITIGISYDEELLKEQIDSLSCLDSNNIKEPQNASFKYTEDGYVIVEAVQGNKINKDVLYENVKKAILNKETTLDLESTDCYVKPKYTSQSQEVIELKDMLNRYVFSEITYTFGNQVKVIDGSVINNWLSVDENLSFTFDEKKAAKYIKDILSEYNTVGKTRKFVTTSGKTINIDGGDYGWKVDINKEVQTAIAAIKDGKIIKKEPEYIQTAQAYGSNDIGNTYVEIDITKQHLWFYKDGSLLADGDVVTGNLKANEGTPKGIYRLKYKKRNAVLRGPGYASPVAFWMPFNGGIGIHDATWRSKFGGNIYKTNGSHGCVNCPYSLAKKIFENIKAGTPVICYY